MITKAKNNKQILFRRLNYNDFDNLFEYLNNLSIETKKRFAPHQFDKIAIELFYQNDKNIGFVVEDIELQNIVAYAIVKIGFLENESKRLNAYELALNHKTDCTFAPSVADSWQSYGLGDALFKYILSELKSYQIKRIILWGGVQADNDKAISYYKKNGFEVLGEFYNNGNNFDMLKKLKNVNIY